MKMALSEDRNIVGILQRNDKYLRLKTLLNHAGYELYCKLYFDSNYGGFTCQPDLIYKKLLDYKDAVDALKAKCEISNEEYLTIYPPSEETYLRECNLRILHLLCYVCIKKFLIVGNQPVMDSNENKNINVGKQQNLGLRLSEKTESVDANFFLKHLEKLQTFIQDENLQKLVNDSDSNFESKWEEIINILNKVGYNVIEVADIETVEHLDSHEIYHEAFLRSEIELLSKECNSFIKTSEINTITLNRLINNLKEAFVLEGKKDKDVFLLQEMTDLERNIKISMNMLNITHQELQALFPDLKFWKDKNIEGDIIIIDLKLNKLSVEVVKQSRSVHDYFNTVSFDIVKIKEKLSNQDTSNVRYVSSHQTDHKQ